MVKLLLLFQKQTNKQTKTNAREMPGGGGGDGHAWNWLSHYISLIAMLEFWCPNNHSGLTGKTEMIEWSTDIESELPLDVYGYIRINYKRQVEGTDYNICV